MKEKASCFVDLSLSLLLEYFVIFVVLNGTSDLQYRCGTSWKYRTNNIILTCGQRVIVGRDWRGTVSLFHGVSGE